MIYLTVSFLPLISNDICYPLASPPIPIRIARLCHCVIRRLICQKVLEFRINRLLVRADKFERSCLDPLRSLGRVAHNKNRLTETRRFLLYPAGIGQDQVASCHKVVEIKHIERLDDVDSLVVAEDRVRSLAHYGVHVDRVDRLDVGVLVHHAVNRAEHLPHRLTEVLATVGGNENQPTALCPVEFGVTVVLAHRRFQRVDGGVAGDIDRACVLALADEVLLRQFGRRKVIATDDTDRLAIELLGVRAVNVVCTKSRLDVSDRDLQVEARERGHEGGRGIAVDEDNVRLDFFEDFLDTIKYIRRDVEQGLLVLHDG